MRWFRKRPRSGARIERRNRDEAQVSNMSTPIRPPDTAPIHSSSLRRGHEDPLLATHELAIAPPRRRSRSRTSRLEASSPRQEAFGEAAERVISLERPRAPLPHFARQTPNARPPSVPLPHPVNFEPPRRLQTRWEENVWRWHDDSMRPTSMYALPPATQLPPEPWYTPEDMPKYKNLAPLMLDPIAYQDDDCPFTVMPVQTLAQPVALRAELVWHVMEDCDLREYWRRAAAKSEPLQDPINRQPVQRSSSVRRVIWYVRARTPMTPPTSPEAAPSKRRRL